MTQGSLLKAWQEMIIKTPTLPVLVKMVQRYYDADFMQEPSRHDAFELLYMKRGEAIFEIAGKGLSVGPNDIVLIKPGQPHKMIVQGKHGVEFIVLNFKFADAMDARDSEVTMSHFLDYVSGREAGAYMNIKVPPRNDIIKVLENMVHEAEENDIGNEFLTHLYVMQLFVFISRALKSEWEDSIKDKSPKIHELVQLSVKYIRNNFERDIMLSDVAKHVFLSPSYFTRAFKDIMGMSPINFLLKIRVERAKELLAETDDRISDIALAVGFSNQQRFNEIFKKYAEITPLKFRKASRTAKKTGGQI